MVFYLLNGTYFDIFLGIILFSRSNFTKRTALISFAVTFCSFDTYASQFNQALPRRKETDVTRAPRWRPELVHLPIPSDTLGLAFVGRPVVSARFELGPGVWELFTDSSVFGVVGWSGGLQWRVIVARRLRAAGCRGRACRTVDEFGPPTAGAADCSADTPPRLSSFGSRFETKAKLNSRKCCAVQQFRSCYPA